MRDGLDLTRVNRLLADGPWPHGELVSSTAERIGAEFGFSAEIHRIHAMTVGGESVSLVAKHEHVLGCRRSIAAHRHATPALGRAVPRLWASDVPAATDEAGTGLLLLEDVHPSEQGDELITPTRERALDLVRIVARLHDVPPTPGVVDRWEPFVSPPERWVVSVDRVQRRSPGAVGVSRRRQLSLRDDAIEALDGLSDDDSWIHVDPHLDNVLWRPDGSTVLLDWSNSRIGPPEVDLAVLFFTFGFRDVEVLSLAELVDAYVSARRSSATDSDATGRRLEAALVLHARSVLGWVGGPASDECRGRTAQVRDDATRRVGRVIDWIDR